jgi:hypothetical protein
MLAAKNWALRNRLMVILLFFSTVMTLLVAEQGRVIETQRTLIRQLFHDSLELSAFKMRELRSRGH